MSRIRVAAATFIEAGRAIGHYETLKRTRERLADAMATGKVALLEAELAEQVKAADEVAAEQQLAAERLIIELEHPGAALAVRLLQAWAAARAAWRG